MVAPEGTGIEVRRGVERFVTWHDGVCSRHSFSFGRHYDPRDTHFGLLLAHNDDTLQPGSGFPPHPHRDLEVVTWVLSGALRHEDSTGHAEVVRPGEVQWMSAGGGVVHTETAATDAGPVRYVQMWVAPDTAGGRPRYRRVDVSGLLAGGGLVPVAGGSTGGTAAGAEPPLRIGQRGAVLHVARLTDGGSITVPDAPYVHLYVARGALDLDGAGQLLDGDAARLTRAGAREAVAAAPAEVLVWAMDAALPGPDG